MARRRSVVRRAGAGRRIPAGVVLGIVLVIGALALIIARVSNSGGSDAALQTGDDAAAVAGRVATGPARASESFFQRIGRMWNASDRIDQLERENRELQAWRDLAERLAERNARYEALLRMPPDAFGEGADVEHSIAAQLVLDSGGPFTRTLVANAGADHGVRVGFIAVNENGLVGRVVSVGHRSSRILMLDDYNSRIPVMGEASRVRAVLAGQATRPPELITHPYQIQSPRLDFIVGAQNLREGERVITSGDGGLFPRGIPVGVARRQGDGSWRVALSAAQRPIDFVRILPYMGVERPEGDPVESEGPPASSSSSVAAIGRETMAPPPRAAAPTPPPSTQTAAQTPRPRPAPPQTPAATPPSPAEPAPAAQTAPAPAEPQE
ncbi:MAG: rod shape-determining protein MreC [Hyphomonadaceae bacterium]|nr:rod shape-determining protein MreC [Hyphomonadaceae bacterium]